MADGIDITPGTGATVATDDTGATGHAQVMKLAVSANGDITFIPADSTYGLDVDVTRVKPDGTNTMPSLDTASRRGYVQVTDGTNTLPTLDTAARRGYVQVTDGTNTMPTLDAAARRGYVQATDGTNVALITNDARLVTGDEAHDAADAGNPVKIGYKAIAHGTNPTAVAANDRTDAYANRAGIPFVMGGHPNIQTVRLQFTAAQTDVAIVTVGTGTKIVVTALQVTLDNASTVFPLVRIGFGASTTPTTTGVIAAHGGVPAGGGFSRGDGSGILGIGADGDDLRITTTGVATGNGVEVVVTYYTIES